MTTNQLFEITEGLVFVVLMEDEPIHQIDPITGAINRCQDYTCPCFDDEAASMEQDPNDWQPPYGRADAEGDLATAAYYDEAARRRGV